MKTLPAYRDSYPHLMEIKRIELASDYLVHEFRKIFPKISREDARHSIENLSPIDKNSNDIKIRDFWNLFCSMCYSWRLKELHYMVTDENVFWKKKKVSIQLLKPLTPQGWMAKTNINSYDEAIDYLRSDNRLTEDLKESSDFCEPFPKIVRNDSLEIRKRILKLTQKQAQERGITKSTFHNLKKNAGCEKQFKIYSNVIGKLK